LSVFAFVTSAAGAAAQAAQTHGGDASSVGLPQLDPAWWPSQLFWLAITFGVLYWLMHAHFLPRIGGVLEERRNRIADDLDQAVETRQQAEDAETAYNQALADAKAKAQTVAANKRAVTDEEIAELQKAADEKEAANLAAAEARIGEMRNDAISKVREAAVETTKAVVEALIDETPTDEAASAAIASVQ